METMTMGLVVVDKPNTPEQAISLTDPDTGEVVALAEADRELCARVLGRTELAIQDQLDMLRVIKLKVGERMLELMDQNSSWTADSRGVKVRAPSPTAGTVTWDAELLETILDRLVEREVITREAKLKAVEQKVTTVVHQNGVKALQKIPAVAKAIKRAQRKVDPPRRTVSVKITDSSEL